MRPGLEKAVEVIKETAREKPLVFVVMAFVILVLVIFWKSLLLVLQGLFYAAIALLVIFAVILVWIKLHYRQPSKRRLSKEKKMLLHAIKIAEKRYMQRKLSEKGFNKIFKEKQRKLIEIEALIDQKYNSEQEKVSKELLAVQSKKRHILKNLLEEKRRVIKEMDIAEKHYLKRKIDAKTYQELVQKNQQNLIDLEANIKVLYHEANVSKVMEKLKKKMSELEKPKKPKKKDKKGERREQLKIAREIAKQVSKK